jgi:hypothetical protein
MSDKKEVLTYLRSVYLSHEFYTLIGLYLPGHGHKSSLIVLLFWIIHFSLLSGLSLFVDSPLIVLDRGEGGDGTTILSMMICGHGQVGTIQSKYRIREINTRCASMLILLFYHSSLILLHSNNFIRGIVGLSTRTTIKRCEIEGSTSQKCRIG